MILFRLREILQERGWTPYRLARETGLTVATAYRLAAAKGTFGRFSADTLDRICSALRIQPGDLLQWRPNSKPLRLDRLTIPRSIRGTTRARKF